MEYVFDPALLDSGKAVDIDISGIPDDDGYPTGFGFAESAAVHAKGVFINDGLELEGHISAKLSVQCARCLTDMEYQSEVDFCEFFAETPADDEVYPIEKNKVRLDRMILDAISLSLPIRFLCKEDCRGLCPKCGTDLNKGDCDCEKNENVTSPFDKLKGLFD